METLLELENVTKTYGGGAEAPAGRAGHSATPAKAAPQDHQTSRKSVKTHLPST